MKKIKKNLNKTIVYRNSMIKISKIYKIWKLKIKNYWMIMIF